MEMATGRRLRSDELCLHHCDNRSCVNQEHLFVGTHQDNAIDKARKWRGRTGRLPYGVSIIEGTIVSKVKLFGVTNYLGTAKTIEEAHERAVKFKVSVLGTTGGDCEFEDRSAAGRYGAVLGLPVDRLGGLARPTSPAGSALPADGQPVPDVPGGAAGAGGPAAVGWWGPFLGGQDAPCSHGVPARWACEECNEEATNWVYSPDVEDN